VLYFHQQVTDFSRHSVPDDSSANTSKTTIILHSDDPDLTLTFEHPGVVPVEKIEDLIDTHEKR